MAFAVIAENHWCYKGQTMRTANFQVTSAPKSGGPGQLEASAVHERAVLHVRAVLHSFQGETRA